MKSHLFLSIGMATAMLGGSIAVVTSGSVAVASSKTDADAKRAARLMDKATQLVAKRKGAAAVRAAEAAVALMPAHGAYRTVLGQAYLHAGRFESARQAFTDALALDPTDGKAALNLALAQTALGEWVAARETLAAHADRIAPGDRGLALALSGDPVGGVAILGDAARDPAATGTVRQNLALALALAGRWVDARAVAAVDMSPADVDRRIMEWAAFTRPASAAAQVATLLGVTPVADPGQPVQLALVRAPIGLAEMPSATMGQPATVADESVVAVSDPVPAAPLAVAAVPAASEAVTFAAPREIVQALPDSYARNAVAQRPSSSIAAPRAVMAPVRSASLAAPASAPVAATGNYYVQLGAYESADVAQDAWRRFVRAVPQLSALPPRGAQATVGGSTFYRLSVGGFARSDAMSLCTRVRAKGARCFVRGHAGDRMAAWRAAGAQIAVR